MFCLYVYTHACLYVYIHAWCLWRPKAVTRSSSRTGVTDVTDGCEAPCSLNCSAVSPVPAITFLMSQCYCVSRKLHYFWIGKDIISQLVVGSKVLLCPWPAAHIPFSFPDVVLCNNLASRRPVLLRLLHPLHWADLLPPGCCAALVTQPALVLSRRLQMRRSLSASCQQCRVGSRSPTQTTFALFSYLCLRNWDHPLVCRRLFAARNIFCPHDFVCFLEIYYWAGHEHLACRRHEDQMDSSYLKVSKDCENACFGSTHAKVGMIQKRLVWSLCKMTQIHEAVYSFSF